MSRRREERKARALRRRRRKVFLWGAGIVATVALVALIALIALTSQFTGEGRRISPAEAKALLDSGSAVLYDTRSAQAYAARHAAGAVSFPESEQEARLDTLPADKDLIFY